MNPFKPGTALLDSLNFSRKFQLILLILILPLTYSGIVIYEGKSQLIENSKQQLKGMDVVSSLHPLRILGAKHRGTAAQWYAGNQGKLSNLKALEQEMEQAFTKATAKLNSFGFSKSTLSNFEQIKKQWLNLNHSKLSSMSSDQSFVGHSAWIARVTQLVDQVAGQTQLYLDSNMSSYMLMQLVVMDVPAVQEYLGQLRGRGAGVATAGSFTPQSFISVSTLYDSITQVWNKTEDHFKTLEENYAEQAGSLATPFNNAKNAVDNFKSISQTQLIQPDQPVVSGSDYFAAGTSAITNVAKFYSALLKSYNVFVSKTKAEEQRHLVVLMGLFIALVLLGMYLFTALKQSVDHNVQITLSMADALEKGQLVGDFKSQSKDELGRAIHSLNSAFQHIRKMVGQVRTNSTTLTATSSELQDVSKDVNTLGQSQKQKVEIIVTAATELAATAKEVAGHCEIAESETKGAKNKANGGAQRSQASAKVIRELAESIRKASDEISELAQQAASISTVIDVIKAIAEQTNLLALNAAIEAARAGEQGRGFAVVADEVRTLANRTQESTNEIESTISNLQLVAEQAVTAMGHACEQAGTGESEAIETGEALADIENSVNQVSEIIMQVAAAGEQQAMAASEIAQHIQEVDDASTHLVERATNVAQVASKVGTGSMELDDTVKKFNV